ncbi:glycoside hydrolase superfamily [Ochromonadaceae sp. CCMP2298]|nr:glycoside hydrolase superfamily [Ochromonadaceae sp. CCMP2298]
MTVARLLLALGALCAGSAVGGDEQSFRWGAATAAYQTEGATSLDGRGPSIWDTYAAIPGNIFNNENGNVADDSYNLVEEDIALMKSLGLNSYRFSISWSRILPQGVGQVNQAGVDHYNRLIDSLLRSGIEPYVTLYHWDLPQALEDKYEGWLSPKVEADFLEYAAVCFGTFGDRVTKWMTINEPWTSSYMGYQLGVHAPGRCSDRSRCLLGNSSTEPYIAAHNMLNAHAAVVLLYRTVFRYQGGQIGIVVNQDWAEPITSSQADQAAAARRRQFQIGWFLDPIFLGHYPPAMVQNVGDRLPVFTAAQRLLLLNSCDFLGLNHYSSKYYSAPTQEQLEEVRAKGEEGWEFDAHAVASSTDSEGQLIGPQGESAWLHTVPWGFHAVIMYVHDRYAVALVGAKPSNSSTTSTLSSLLPGVGGLGSQGVPIYITENGCDAPGEAQMSVAEALQDSFRVDYLSRYLEQMQLAMAQGVDIRGYFVWSLLDNFEWSDGYEKRFGIVYVDNSDDKGVSALAAVSPSRPRYLKDSARWYKQHVEEQMAQETAEAEETPMSAPVPAPVAAPVPAPVPAPTLEPPHARKWYDIFALLDSFDADMVTGCRLTSMSAERETEADQGGGESTCGWTDFLLGAIGSAVDHSRAGYVTPNLVL